MLTALLASLCLISAFSQQQLSQGGNSATVCEAATQINATDAETPEDSGSSDTDYRRTIKIWIDYNWNMVENKTYTITYATLWSGIEGLIKQNQFDIEELRN